MTITTVFADSLGDGRAERLGQDTDWVTLTGGVGTAANSNQSNFTPNALRASSTSNQYAESYRVFTPFDTSGLPDGDVISAAIYDLYYTTGFFDQLSGASSLNSQVVLVETSPASDTAIVAADYQNGHRTVHGTDLGRGISQADIATAGVGYVDPITLNASGLALISTTSLTRLGVCSAWDFDQTTTGLTWSSGGFQLTIAMSANTAGTAQDPKITITHAPPAGGIEILRRRMEAA